jgi:hypothetical protein
MAKPTKEDVITDAARFDKPMRSTMIALGESHLCLSSLSSPSPLPLSFANGSHGIVPTILAFG